MTKAKSPIYRSGNRSTKSAWNWNKMMKATSDKMNAKCILRVQITR